VKGNSPVKIKSLAAAAAVAGLAIGLLGANAALADPPALTYGTLAGVGSDTTQSVLNGIASDYAASHSGTYLLSSYDAVGSATIQTKADAACAAITRPANSGGGVDALHASLIANAGAGDGCIDFARSSSGPGSAQTGYNLQYIKFATDAVTYSIRSDSAISKTLTTAQLKAIYDCTAGAAYVPLLPNFGSGTRKFFLASLGYSSTDQNNASFSGSVGHTCVTDAGEENTGTLLTDPKNIIPFSIGSYLGQYNGVAPAVLGKAVLGRVNNIGAFTLNGGSSFARSVYNVIPTGKLADPNYIQAFVGTNGSGLSNDSFVCQDTATILKYGFALNAACGGNGTATP